MVATTAARGLRGRLSILASAAGAVALVAASAACTSSSREATPQSTDPDAVLSVTFQPATESFAVLTQLNAFAGDYFTAEKLDVTYNAPIPNAAQAAQSVTTDADIAIVGSTGVVPGVAARRDMVTVAVITKGPTTQITLRNDVIERLGITPDAPIRDRITALRGLSIALPQPGSTTDVAVRQAMKLYGLDPDQDVTIRPITEPAALVTAMREGQVDGFAFSAPTSVQPVAEGYASVWVSLSDIPEMAQLPWIDVVTSKTFLENNREVVKRFLRALVKAAADLETDPEAAKARIKEKYFPQLDLDVFDLAFELSLPTALQGLEPSADGLRTLLETVNSNSDNTLEVTAEQLYDTSVLAEVLAE